MNIDMTMTIKKIIIFFAFILSFSQTTMAREQFLFESISESDIKSIKKKFLNHQKSSPNNQIILPPKANTPLQLNISLGDKIIKYLMMTERYKSVSLIKSQKGLIIKGEKSRIIRKISIKGNKIISNKKIASFTSLSEGQGMNRSSLIQGVSAIKKYYSERGYINVNVQVKIVSTGKDGIHLKYVIEENEPCLADNIVITTTNNKIKKKILSKIKKYKNKVFSNKLIFKIDESIKNTLQENRYITSQLEQVQAIYNEKKTRVKIEYKIRNPYKYEIYIFGNKEYSRSSILRTFGIKKVQSHNIDPVNEMRIQLKDRYKRDGFIHVKVDYTIESHLSSFIKKVVFKITEGPKVKINKIKVSGILKKKSKRYEEFISQNSSDLVASGYYNLEDIKIGRDNLIAHLRNQGYLQAIHISTSIKYLNRDKSLGDISILIDEGLPTKIHHIKFTGANFFTNQQLIKQVGIKVGSPLKNQHVKDGVQKLKDFYANQGFLDFYVRNEESKNIITPKKPIIQFNNLNNQEDLNFNHQVDLAFMIYEGPQIKVASILIEGHSITKDYVILKELNFNVGDVLTRKNILLSQKALNRLGIFSQVDIQVLGQGTTNSWRTVLIRIREANPGSFKTGLGLTNERQLTGRSYVGAAYNNIRGTSRSLSGRLDYQVSLVEKRASNELQATMGYLEPYLFDSMWRGRINSIAAKELRDQDEQVERYAISQTLDLILEKNFSQEITFNWTLLSWTQRRLDIEPKPNSSLSRKTLNELKIAQIGPSLDFEYRDSPFLPTKGYYGKLSAFYASPLLGSSDPVHFFKMEGNFRHYLPIGETRWIWANSYSAGYIKDILGNNGQSGIPFLSFFFLGGQRSIRGFGGSDELERIPSSDTLSLSDPSSSTQLRQAELIQTEKAFYGLFRSEIRFPIKGVFGGVLFYDVGGVHMSDISQRKTWRQSFGVGLRLNSPFGPIVLDYARKINPLSGIGRYGQQNERESKIHVSIGTF